MYAVGPLLDHAWVSPLLDHACGQPLTIPCMCSAPYYTVLYHACGQPLTIPCMRSANYYTMHVVGPLTLWRRRTQSSPIFAKLLQLVPRGTLSSELFEFLRYLYPFQRYAKFSFFVIFNSACLFENLFLRKLQCLKYFLRWIQIRWNF